MRQRGSALLTSVIVVMVLFLISGIFFSIVMYQTRLETSEEKALKAYYLAEAGVNYEIAQVLNQATPPPQNDVITVSAPFGSDYGGEFSVQWVDDGNGHTFTVSSSGSYQGIKRTLNEQYKYPQNPNP